MTSSCGKPQLFTLSNGLTLIVEEDHTLPIAAVNACCGTGFLHEGKHLGLGISHMLEHMFFKGTPQRPSGTIDPNYASTKIFGFFLAIERSFLAAPEGWRVPYSQLIMLVGFTPRKEANTA